MDMVWHDFKGKNLAVKFSYLLFNETFESSLDFSNENLSSVLRAPNEMIAHEVNGSLRREVTLWHTLDAGDTLYIDYYWVNSLSSHL